MNFRDRELRHTQQHGSLQMCSFLVEKCKVVRGKRAPAPNAELVTVVVQGAGVEKVSETSVLNGGKSVVEEGELWRTLLACFAGSPVLEVHTFSRRISILQKPWPKIAIERLSQCSDQALILVAPHYGLRYGFASATGDFQRLRGRPPLVSPLKLCMRRSFTA